jgi:hypothetical protein
MITVSADHLAVIRRDACDVAFVSLLEFGLGSESLLRIARYDRDIAYGGQIYTAWAYEAQLRSGGRGNQVKTVTMTIQDQARRLRPTAIATNWFRGCWLAMTVVRADTAASLFPTIAYDIKSAKPSGESIALTLGGVNTTKMRFPADRYWAWQCPYARGFADDPRCGYAGAETTCNGTPSRCAELGNIERFGGFFGLDPDASQIVLPASLRRLA